MPLPPPSVAELAKMIDHSLLHPTLTDASLDEGLALSRAHAVATACVKPYHTARAAAALAGSSVGVCAVIGFPHGNSTPAIKVAECIQAIHDGASEIDMVANAGKVLGGDWGYVRSEIDAVNRACRANQALLKVIFENDFLPATAIVRLCQICTELEVAFVKTSTGYGFVKQANGDYNYKGATDAHLRLMRASSGPLVQIKSAGGIRSLEDLLRVRALGVSRIGATATAAILADAARRYPERPAPQP